MVIAYQRRLFSFAVARRRVVREDLSRGVLERVAREFGVTPERIVSHERTKPLCEARWVIVGLLRQHGPMALGRLLDRDHATIIHAERAFDARPDLQAIASRL